MTRRLAQKGILADSYSAIPQATTRHGARPSRVEKSMNATVPGYPSSDYKPDRPQLCSHLTHLRLDLNSMPLMGHELLDFSQASIRIC
jgi:hypothetical protein